MKNIADFRRLPDFSRTPTDAPTSRFEVELYTPYALSLLVSRYALFPDIGHLSLDLVETVENVVRDSFARLRGSQARLTITDYDSTGARIKRQTYSGVLLDSAVVHDASESMALKYSWHFGAVLEIADAAVEG